MTIILATTPTPAVLEMLADFRKNLQLPPDVNYFRPNHMKPAEHPVIPKGTTVSFGRWNAPVFTAQEAFYLHQGGLALAVRPEPPGKVRLYRKVGKKPQIWVEYEPFVTLAEALGPEEIHQQWPEHYAPACYKILMQALGYTVEKGRLVSL